MDSVVRLSGYAIIIYFTLSIIYRLARGLWHLKLGYLLGFSEQFKPKESNSWAIITGATDGIGLSYAHEFSKKGYNLLLISRSEDKLNKVKQEIDKESNKKGKQIDIHIADFTKTDIYDGIEKKIKTLPRVDVLINNVGMSYEHPEFYASPHLEKTNQNILYVNCFSCSRMCYIILPIMEKQNHGVILNISSFSALDPVPLLSIYAASKAFVDSFSRSIAYEYAKKGITIQSVLPGFVATKMSKIRKANWMAPSADDYVKSQLKTVGLDSFTTGFWSHELQYYITQYVFPYTYDRSISSNIAYNQMKLARHKALKKAQRLSGDQNNTS